MTPQTHKPRIAATEGEGGGGGGGLISVLFIRNCTFNYKFESSIAVLGAILFYLAEDTNKPKQAFASRLNVRPAKTHISLRIHAV